MTSLILLSAVPTASASCRWFKSRSRMQEVDGGDRVGVIDWVMFPLLRFDEDCADQKLVMFGRAVGENDLEEVATRPREA